MTMRMIMIRRMKIRMIMRMKMVIMMIMMRMIDNMILRMMTSMTTAKVMRMMMFNISLIFGSIACSIFSFNIKWQAQRGVAVASVENHSLFDSIRWFPRTNNTKRRKMWKNEECGTSCVQLFHKQYKNVEKCGIRDVRQLFHIFTCCCPPTLTKECQKLLQMR